jgi:uncharacterized protein YbjT (DUF2867 family)
MNHKDNIILVSGATGQQGGAVARHLLADGWRVRALTRNPEAEGAKALAAQGAELAAGDMASRSDMDRALAGAYGVFSVQNTWTSGVDGEIIQGKTLAGAAKAARVQHFVYTSVGGSERNSGIPHFESKWQLEQHIRSLGLPATILRPVFFMENFRNFSAPKDGVLAVGLKPTTSLQMIAVNDIGAFAAMAFAEPAKFMGKALELAGDSLTMPEVAETMTRVTGQPVQFVEVPLEQVRQYSPETAIMNAWFNEHGYRADIAALRAIHPGLLTFENWLRQ